MNSSGKVQERQKIKIITKCCVPGCSSTSVNSPNLSFYRIPPQDRPLSVITSKTGSDIKAIHIRDVWIEKLQVRKLLKNSRVCSLHFLSTDYVLSEYFGECTVKRRLLNKYAIPSQNLPTPCSSPRRQQELVENSLSSPSARGSTSPFLRTNLLETNVTPRTSNPTSPGTKGSTSKFKVTESFERRDVVKCDLRTIFDVLNDVRCDNPDCPEMQFSESLHEGINIEDSKGPEPESLDPGVRNLTEDTNHIDASIQVDTRDLITHQDVSVQVDTRDLTTHEDASVQVTSGHIYSPFSTRIITDHQLVVLCGIRNQKILDRLILEMTTIYPEQRKHKMTMRERAIMTLMKLKNDLKFSCLAIIFDCVAESTCRAIFIDTLQKLAKVLKGAIHWVPKEEIAQNMPLCFRHFEETVCVVDCTEFKIQAPKYLACRCKVYSQYESGFTAKYMTAVSPGGLLTYVSEGFGGCASDAAIFEHSNIISLLQPGDAVMADKGFRIDDLCHKYQVKLYRPPYLQKQQQFSTEDGLFHRRIAAARVHVERMNQRIETFDVLNNKISWNLLNHVNDIVTVCCGLANLGTPILADVKFM